MDEPILTPADEAEWHRWRLLWTRYGRTERHRNRVEEARRAVQRMRAEAPRAYSTWSGGKDSTALLALCVEEGVTRVMVQQDDYDFPGKPAYIQQVAAMLGVIPEVISTQIPGEMLAQEAPGEDIHGPRAAFSQPFYAAVEKYAADQGFPGLYLGLRASESRGRALNLRSRGLIYQRQGEWRCCPLGRWGSEDVFAFLLARGLPVMAPYRCCADRAPGDIRMAWWLPGRAATRGQAVWLRRYWPSLYRRWLDLQPQGSTYA